MRGVILAAVAALSLAACGGTGGQTAAPFTPAGPAGPTPAPIVQPTSVPVNGPTNAPTTAPVKVMQAAPLASTPTLTFLRRPQAATSSLPLLVESSGVVAINAGNFIVWVTNAATSQDVAEASGTITATNSLAVTNPAFSAISCPTTSAVWCAAHPLGWQFGTASTTNKPIGKQTLTVAFGDGTTGQIFDYIYPSFSLTCNSGFVFSSGAVVATSTIAASDVYADCTANLIRFPGGGGQLFSNPTQDSFGRYETIMPTFTAAFVMAVTNGTVPMASIAQGQVFGIRTQDGGMAKVYMGSSASSTTTTSVMGMALHANVDGTYAF